jgi:formate dehydrogenase iron-sulfur subunit
MTTEPMALLYDMTRCGGCRECIAACMEGHDFPGDPEEVTELSATAYTALDEFDEDYSYRKLCRHCVTPSCASACPAGALIKQPLGPVSYDASKCMGCRYCITACPFDVPKYEWDKAVPAVRKCDMCWDLVQEGGTPRCADVCRYEATMYGTREELIAEAWSRIEDDPDEYHPHVYGEHELGGTSVLFLTPVPVEQLGFDPAFGTDPIPARTKAVLEQLPGIGVTACAGLFALSWIIRRRNEVQAFEARERRAERNEVHHASRDN